MLCTSQITIPAKCSQPTAEFSYLNRPYVKKVAQFALCTRKRKRGKKKEAHKLFEGENDLIYLKLGRFLYLERSVLLLLSQKVLAYKRGNCERKKER